MTIRLLVTFSLTVCVLGFTSPALAAKLLCVDSENNDRVVLKRKKCREPRYSEFDPTLKLQTVSQSQEVSLSATGDFSGNTVDCPEGTLSTGGGASISDNNGLNIRRSIPRSDLSGWTVSVESVSNNATGIMNLYVVCATGAAIEVEGENT